MQEKDINPDLLNTFKKYLIKVYYLHEFINEKNHTHHDCEKVIGENYKHRINSPPLKYINT